MFENLDGRPTDAPVIDILIAHLGAFGSGELKRQHLFFLVISFKCEHLFFLVISFKMPTFVGILKFMSRKNFMLK